MYYCITCNQFHEINGTSWVFKTGFYSIPATGKRIPIGICKVKKEAAGVHIHNN